ncbi:hypothetical protein BRAS3843_2560029 [Bradyrhizobium sp. STM 3843]|uniref:caspase family protein n=1 Tax=Bradyrhizobium sp. STM 3843 TaxID=551947 RepID=UPI0002404C70|nr:caspase family protein [Bradyrhizobium sp. STM 3843]CCE08080.1 hypothetical protein BRAS3843_2560029 [Bradyrhizobium sp. STM 3843]
MSDQIQSNYHVLLIGIDAYSVKPLHGCVNDIDAIQRLLLGERVAIPRDRIRRLASPHPKSPHETTVDSKPATLANMRTALAELGSEKVAKGDHVFIYYSGHGSRVHVRTPDKTIFHRESLVPVDFNVLPNQCQLMLDFELNQLLQAITERTSAVTVCLDCCNSAGATRDVERDGLVARFIDSQSEPRLAEPLAVSPEIVRAERLRGVAAGVEECQVVAACLNHEEAKEFTDASGVRNGMLTHSLVTSLSAMPDNNLRSVPWARIWQKMRADVETRNPWQHLWMAGNLARNVIAGEPVADDPGLSIERTEGNSYRVYAGTLASITPGAMLAVYGDKPPKFPALDSDDDRKARLGDVLLKVTRADRSTSFAEADGAPFDLPPGARGRLVRSGTPARLRCALVPQSNELLTQLSSSPLLEIVDKSSSEVQLVRGADGSWALTDDVHGAKPGYPVLYTLRPENIDRAKEVLEHYFYYALPLRMATLCSDLLGALQVSLLASPKNLTSEEAQAAELPEATRGREFPYDLVAGDNFCIRVRNSSREHLRVTLLNSAASGRVQLLGDQEIDPNSFYVFWVQNNLGIPFSTTLPSGATQSIDRIVAIGTTALGRDLSYLRVDARFADVANATRGAGRDIEDNTTSSPPAEQWTATQTIVRTVRAAAF